MKYLFIIRHGKAAFGEPQFDDFDRPLTSFGRQTVGDLSSQSVVLGLTPDVVLCSTTRRTRETLAGLQDVLPSHCKIVFDDDLYLASRPLLVTKIQETEDEYSALMLVGHNPGLEQLLSWLIGDDTDSSLIKFLPPCGFVKLAFNVNSWDRIKQGSALLKNYVLPEETL